MNKYINLKTLTIGLLVAGAGIAVVQCNKKREEREEVVYVRSYGGSWLPSRIFMNNNGNRDINYGDYQYATKNSNGTYSEYKPTSNEFSSMKSGTYTGKSIVRSAISTNHSSSGKTTRVGGSSTRVSGIGG